MLASVGYRPTHTFLLLGAGWLIGWISATIACQPTGTAMVFVSRNSASPATPISLPIPDCLYPPNGASGAN